MASLASKAFAVTGGASGIGLATCRMLAQPKAKGISVADYNDRIFESVRAELQSISHDMAVHTKKSMWRARLRWMRGLMRSSSILGV